MSRAKRTIFLAAAVLLAAAGGAGQRPKAWHFGIFDQAPAQARRRVNPLDGQPAAVRAGRKLFRRHCAECHGEEAFGTYRAPNLHATPIQGATPGTLAWLLWNGNVAHGMPSWSGLPELRRWQIVTYLKTLGAPPAAGLPTAAETPNPAGCGTCCAPTRRRRFAGRH